MFAWRVAPGGHVLKDMFGWYVAPGWHVLKDMFASRVGPGGHVLKDMFAWHVAPGGYVLKDMFAWHVAPGGSAWGRLSVQRTAPSPRKSLGAGVPQGVWAESSARDVAPRNAWHHPSATCLRPDPLREPGHARLCGRKAGPTPTRATSCADQHRNADPCDVVRGPTSQCRPVRRRARINIATPTRATSCADRHRNAGSCDVVRGPTS